MSRRSPADISEHALALHRDALVVDLHADTLLPMRMMGYRMHRRHRVRMPRSAWVRHCDLPRFVEGGVDGQFFGVVTGPFPGKAPLRSALRQMSRLERVAAAHPDKIRLIRTGTDLEAAKREGVLAAFIGVEGAHALARNPANVAAFAARGVRYLSLSHLWSGAAGPGNYGIRARPGAPLPELGREIIAAMNAQRVILDLAHLGRGAMAEAISLAAGPVIVSHTGVCGVHDHPRNLTDEHLRAVADTGGVVGIMFSNEFLGPDAKHGAVAVVRHMEHVRNTVGAAHVALGSDFDGFIVPPRDLPDVAALPLLTAIMLERGWPEDDIRAALGLNVLRVLRAHDRE